MSLMATPYAKCNKLTKVGRNYYSHHDKASENCGPLRLEGNARKHTANYIYFSHHILFQGIHFVYHIPHNYGMHMSLEMHLKNREK